MPLKGWKTIVYAGAVFLTGALSSPEMTAWIADNLPMASGAVALGIVILRAITTSPIFKPSAAAGSEDDA